MNSDHQKDVFGYYFQCELSASKTKLDDMCRYNWCPKGVIKETKLMSFKFTLHNEKTEWNLRVNRPSQYLHVSKSFKYLDSMVFSISTNTEIECPILYYALLNDIATKSILAMGSGYVDGDDIKILENVQIDALKRFTCDFARPCVHLYLIDNSVSVDNLSNKSSKVSLKELGLLKQDYCCSLSSNLSNLFNSGMLTDAIVISKDKEFKIHKAIFAARSSYFAALFKNDLLEKKTSCASLKDKCGRPISSGVAENFIKYMYIGAIDNFEECTIELYELAHMYDMSALQSECISYLKSVINVNNATTILLLAKKYDIKELRNVLSAFFKEHAKEIFQSKNFGDFMALI